MGVLPTATALTQREAAYLAAAQANGRRAEAAEALNTRYREALEKAIHLLDDAKPVYGDPSLRRSWGASRKKLREALSSPADSQEQG